MLNVEPKWERGGDMSVLEWDKSGEKLYEAGVDRGVLQIGIEPPVVWNGLTDVSDDSTAERKAYYLDGVKYMESVTPSEYSGKLSAYTYPDEFERALGIDHVADGLSFYEQRPRSFNLSYRTKIGNDIDGIDHGYKIHFLYNLLAIEDSKSFGSLSDQLDANTFSWTLSGVPRGRVSGYRPTVHISVNSLKTDPSVLSALEDVLYGNDTEEPRFPTIAEVLVIFGGAAGLTITDGGDGTWTADDPGDDFITMVDSDTFRIDDADATYSDPDTYTITDTPLP